MTKLRDDVRGAFDKEQAKLGDLRDARHRLVREALVARDIPASHGLQRAAGIAAVLIAAIVIATFALVRAGTHSHAVPATTPSPKAVVSPTPLSNVLNVPDTTPIIVYGDPANPNQLDGATWDGKTSGKLTNQNLVGIPNSQNNLFAEASYVDDRSGATVMAGAFGGKSFQGTWADDGRSFCQVVPFDNPGNGGVPTTLQLVTVAGATRNIARIGTLYNQTFVQVAACSTLSDRAIVVQSGGQGMGTAQVWLVQLSTGHVIWTHSYDVAQTNIRIVASRDGSYVAENLTQSGPSGSTVYGPDGKPVMHLTSWVEALSWDGSLAVVDRGWGTTPVDLISWREGTVFWTCPPGYGLIRAQSEPGGSELAVWLAPTSQFQQASLAPDLYVLSAIGSVIAHLANAGPALP